MAGGQAKWDRSVARDLAGVDDLDVASMQEAHAASRSARFTRRERYISKPNGLTSSSSADITPAPMQEKTRGIPRRGSIKIRGVKRRNRPPSESRTGVRGRRLDVRPSMSATLTPRILILPISPSSVRPASTVHPRAGGEHVTHRSTVSASSAVYPRARARSLGPAGTGAALSGDLRLRACILRIPD